jgi:hypothetical protein
MFDPRAILQLMDSLLRLQRPIRVGQAGDHVGLGQRWVLLQDDGWGPARDQQADDVRHRNARAADGRLTIQDGGVADNAVVGERHGSLPADRHTSSH